MKTLKYLFEQLHTFGDDLFLVGGSVRDILLGRAVHDYDFATSLTPTEIKKRLVECGITKHHTVGEKFGTIGCEIIYPSICHMAVEITTFRGEQYNYVDRKPEVSYIDNIQEDVTRRDFTINAMYLSKKDVNSLNVTDSFSFNDNHRTDCLHDLNKAIIKTVGKAGLRFREDPLRMLRAVRFASQLGFSIEEKTMDMIKRMRVELLKISRERWNQEMEKILSCEIVNFDVLKESCLLSVILPELSYQIDFNQNSLYHDYTLWEHTTRVVNAVPHTDLKLRWAALLHDIGKPFVQTINKKGNTNYIGHETMSAFLVEQIGDRFKWPREQTRFIRDVVSTHLEGYNVLKKYDQMGK